MHTGMRGFVQDMASCVDQHVSITSDATGTYSYSLEPYERIVEVTSTLGVATITMPAVAECAGKLFSITALTGATNAVTVAAKATGESYDWPGDCALNADLDRVLLFSDGRRWWRLTDQFT